MNRRSFIGRGLGAIGAIAGLGAAAKVAAKTLSNDDLLALSESHPPPRAWFYETDDPFKTDSEHPAHSAFADCDELIRREYPHLFDGAVTTSDSVPYRLGRPVITQEMQRNMPCPFPYSEPDL